MTGFERQPSLWGAYQRSRCTTCQGMSREARQDFRGDAVLTEWEERHAGIHATSTEGAA